MFVDIYAIHVQPYMRPGRLLAAVGVAITCFSRSRPTGTNTGRGLNVVQEQDHTGCIWPPSSVSPVIRHG